MNAQRIATFMRERLALIPEGFGVVGKKAEPCRWPIQWINLAMMGITSSPDDPLARPWRLASPSEGDSTFNSEFMTSPLPSTSGCTPVMTLTALRHAEMHPGIP
jgi:hypothetical protein